MQKLKPPRKQADIRTGVLVLVNREHPVRTGDVALAAVTRDEPGILLERTAAKMLRKTIASVGGEKSILPVSGFRTAEEQRAIFDGTLAERGPEFTRKYVALPGCSEHQSGLAVDLRYSAEPAAPDFICPAFPYGGICGAFRRAALRSGFIERYPKGKEHLTGIAHEPWHFRYVGFPHSVVMQTHGFCLEEYMDFIRNFTAERPLFYYFGSHKITVYFTFFPEYDESGGIDTEISGNNADGFIVTGWSA